MDSLQIMVFERARTELQMARELYEPNVQFPLGQSKTTGAEALAGGFNSPW